MHDADPGRGEFDGQGDSVEAPADVGDNIGLIGRRCKARAGLPRAFDEEPNGGAAAQRRHSPGRLTRPAEGSPPRRQEVGVWTGFQDRPGEAGAPPLTTAPAVDSHNRPDTAAHTPPPL